MANGTPQKESGKQHSRNKLIHKNRHLSGYTIRHYHHSHRVFAVYPCKYVIKEEIDILLCSFYAINKSSAPQLTAPEWIPYCWSAHDNLPYFFFFFFSVPTNAPVFFRIIGALPPLRDRHILHPINVLYQYIYTADSSIIIIIMIIILFNVCHFSQ